MFFNILIKQSFSFLEGFIKFEIEFIIRIFIVLNHIISKDDWCVVIFKLYKIEMRSLNSYFFRRYILVNWKSSLFI